jgi:hypothetical protein
MHCENETNDNAKLMSSAYLLPSPPAGIRKIPILLVQHTGQIKLPGMIMKSIGPATIPFVIEIVISSSGLGDSGVWC